ncbi:ankyrin repeat domain-containing protein [Microseira sp. BLCC-F43]|uniref:ankyrin repeat domain-containing protein n=1 Tax=Microseira sp. BLCC-F43 TaxID=3153602 RepID=UPI0035B999B7
MELLHQSGEIIAEKYRILDILGQGASGTTYQVQDIKSGNLFALKALSLRRMTDWKKIELFEREARILSQLNHPAIPRYLEYFHVDTPSDRSFYIAQQLASGKSLAAMVQSGWHANEEQVGRIAIQILEILVYLHQLKPPVIHRDIKPQNIILRSPHGPLNKGNWGDLFLVDFGAVQNTYYNTFMRGSTVVGTYGYMAPEQFRSQAVPATDLYGLGATLLFLLTHRSPTDLPTDGLKIDFRSRIQISDRFADWLEKMLDPDVEDRFPSAKEALAVLQRKPMVTATRSSVPWKSLVAVPIAIVATVTTLNSFKWAILSHLGFRPSAEICENADALRNYLNQGGNIHAQAYKISDRWESYSSGENIPLLTCAVKYGNKELIERLIAKGADVNAKQTGGDTPLHWAAEKGSKEIVELLIAKGASVNAKSDSGDTPLHLANNKYIAELLIAKGADINALVSFMGTPLHKAANNNNKNLAELLIAKGADVNALANDGGGTPLHLANNKYIAELLIAKGADVNAKNNEGNTPLHKAAENNSKEVAELLIAKGADVNAKNNLDDTPMNRIYHYLGTGMNKSKNLRELLKKHGGKESPPKSYHINLRIDDNRGPQN